MAARARWVPVGGQSRRYRNTRTGETISRRQYDNRRAQQAGFKNRYELEKTRERLQGSRWLFDIYQHTGGKPSFQDYHDIAEVKRRRAALRALYGDELQHGELDVKDSELVAADGPLARILDRSGRRPLSGRPVGSS